MTFATDHVRVRVPATSGNLGPGFDAMGMAHGIWDEVEARAVTGATRVVVEGEGAGTVPTGEDHLVVRAARLALAYLDAPQVGLELHCANAITHGRGLGSSAAAAVAGILVVRGLLGGAGGASDVLSDAEVLALACELEGHPDNAAPAIHGGAVISWLDHEGAHSVPLTVDPALRPMLLVPRAVLLTSQARAALPRLVPHADAAFNLSRAALLTVALASRPDLLPAATEDRLHQGYRASSMPASMALLEELRAHRLPAVVSGAGPSLLVFAQLPDAVRADVAGRGWRVHDAGLAGPAHVVHDVPAHQWRIETGR